MFITYLLGRLESLGFAYQSEQEFLEHIMSGEVKMSIPDILNLVSDYEKGRLVGGYPEKVHTSFLSRYAINERVKVFLMPEGEESFPGFNARVTAVHFTAGKVKYDLEVRFYGDFVTRIYNVDSILIKDLEEDSATMLPTS